ncbi:hypothetical protein LEM8419_01852 [Neolewinella maritima]|uniref:Major facilitator superfamily (MFS) profile domain-containing protein n=1 Tax=Neolewinella maritima TaxID=1383882 RepID=A0ABM9B1A7_9BACT|nr:MFS transporter [Neolewinella maritima]CAH1000723.1 hypothetical protein LEM8419_01852 [Neolewinella maritima]
MNPRYLGFGFLHFFFSAIGQTFFISLFVAQMTTSLGWAETTFAGLYSTVTLVAAFLLPLIGKQIDRGRVRYVSTAVGVALLLGTALLAWSPTFALVAVGLFIVRCGGQGVLPLIGSTTIGRYFDARRGRALSLSLIGLSVAEVILPPLVTYAILAYGYGLVWALAGGAVLLLFLPGVWLLVRRYDDFQRADTVAEAQLQAAGDTDATQVASWSRTQVLKDRRFRLILPLVLFIPFVFTGLVFNQSVIAAERGFTAELMAYGLSTYGLVRVVFLLFGGDLIDRLGPATLLRFALVPAVVGLLLLLFVPYGWVVPVFFGLFGASAGTDAVMMPALWAERYGPRFLGSIKSTVRLFVVVSSAAAPIVFSYGLRWGVEAWLGVLLGYGGCCFALAWVEYGVGRRPAA